MKKATAFTFTIEGSLTRLRAVEENADVWIGIHFRVTRYKR